MTISISDGILLSHFSTILSEIKQQFRKDTILKQQFRKDTILKQH